MALSVTIHIPGVANTYYPPPPPPVSLFVLVCLSVSLALSVGLCLSLSICLPLSLSHSLSFSQSLSLILPLSLSVSPSLCLGIFLIKSYHSDPGRGPPSAMLCLASLPCPRVRGSSLPGPGPRCVCSMCSWFLLSLPPSLKRSGRPLPQVAAAATAGKRQQHTEGCLR